MTRRIALWLGRLAARAWTNENPSIPRNVGWLMIGFGAVVALYMAVVCVKAAMAADSIDSRCAITVLSCLTPCILGYLLVRMAAKLKGGGSDGTRR